MTPTNGILRFIAVTFVVVGGWHEASAGKVYWSNGHAVRRADFDGSNIEDVIASIDTGSGVAVDVDGGYVYWTDGGDIKRAYLDGSTAETLVSGLPGNLHDIALDLIGGKMYWSDGGGDIQRANLDGSQVELVLDFVEGSGPGWIDLDVCAGQLYFTHAGEVRRVNFDGMGIALLVTGLVAERDVALDIHRGKLYWTDQGVGTTQQGKLQRADFDGSNVEDLIRPGTGFTNPYALAIDSTRGVLYFSDALQYGLHKAPLEIPEGQTPDNRTDIETLVTGEFVATIKVDDAVVRSCGDVPANSEWGLAAMALLIVGAGIAVYRLHRSAPA
ncbi:MAG: hypothetical protein J5J06_16460 [Phycisphaerae bacterium]|nr:hypothetical protein [Phycisphaerae bacterium]